MHLPHPTEGEADDEDAEDVPMFFEKLHVECVTDILRSPLLRLAMH